MAAKTDAKSSARAGGGSPLETAIGTSNLTALTATMIANEINGSDGAATGNV